MARKTTRARGGAVPSTTAGLSPLTQYSQQLGAPNQRLREVIFDTVSEADLVTAGTRIDTRVILEDVPGFVGMTHEIYKKMTAEQREALCGYSPSLLPILVHEAMTLEQLKQERDSKARDRSASRAQREEALRRAMRRGINLRDAAYDGLRNAFGSNRDRRVELDEVSGTAETPTALAEGLESTAALIRKHLKNPAFAPLLDEFNCGELFARTLTAQAESIRALERDMKDNGEHRVTQRLLDAQDGRVLHLIGMVLRAFRAANRVDESILIPRVSGLARYFTSPKVRRVVPEVPETPAGAPSPTPPTNSNPPK